MKVVVFDMDDTLYDEITYVHSGFKAVASRLEQLQGVSSQAIFERMVEILEQHGRGKVFDQLLLELGVHNNRLVRQCVACYRDHEPKISLFADAERCIQRLKERYPLYLVTDGNKLVQNKKIEALGLRNVLKACYVSHQYGKHRAKPSPYLFMKIADREGALPNQVVYIGDNPNKDFVGIKPLGFKTIRIRRGWFSSFELSNDYEAHVRVQSLDEITPEVLTQLGSEA